MRMAWVKKDSFHFLTLDLLSASFLSHYGGGCQFELTDMPMVNLI
jgi:hypothetical protein